MKIRHMSIKMKLSLTYMTGLMITILLMGLVGYIAHGNRLIPPMAVNDEVDSENMMSYAFQFRTLNSVEEASRSINNAALNLEVEGGTLNLTTESFWEGADQTLRKNVALVVFKNNQTLYQSGKLDKDIDLSLFPKFGEVKAYPNEYLFEKYESTIQRQIDHIADNGDEITIFILFSVASQTGRMVVAILNNLLVFMVFSTIVMGAISFFVVRSITIPLDKLKEAADEVRKGNFEHEVEYEDKHKCKDKIGELSEAFEAMRLQLLENENIRDQYETNRRQMISSISHDIRTPVTAIKLHAEGIMDGVARSPEKMNKYLKSMSNNAKVIDHLLKELILFSNLDAEKETFQFSNVNVDRFIIDLTDEWEYDYQNDDVTFNLNIKETESRCIRLDVIHFRRVLVNLVENALKYVTNRPLIVSIIVEQVDGFTRIRLGDNGDGVMADQLVQIFERFHRVDEARQTSVPGSGLGLSIARQIVLKHGGRIWAQDSDLGGLEICIDLPNTKEEGHGTDSNC